MSAPEETERFWEQRYRGSAAVWSGRPNALLVEVVHDLGGPAPGTALDLGCGEGGDALWLAGLGWDVTAVDVSPTALARVAAGAAASGVGERVRVEQHDLALTFPSGCFDLVTACYFQSPIELPREQVLRTAAAAVAPGGVLVVVEHASGPSWAGEHAHVVFPTAQETRASLGLDPAGWDVERCDTPTREVTSPQGEVGTASDNVVVVRRRA